MQVLNLDEKNTERMDAINKFTLMDDTFMTQVFSSDLECTEELLKIILKRDDLTVTKSVTQLTIGNLFVLISISGTGLLSFSFLSFHFFVKVTVPSFLASLKLYTKFSSFPAA